jgi:protease I
MGNVVIAATAILILAASVSCAETPIVMVIAQREFTEEEYFEPRAVFEKARIKTITCSTSTRTAVGSDGAKIKPDVSTADLKLDGFDAIVLVGGRGAASDLLKDQPLRKILVAAAARKKVIAAICIAPMVLAQAGLLRSIPATCYPDSRTINFLKRNGALYADRTVVVSGRIVTANGPEAAGEFARSVLAAAQP